MPHRRVFLLGKKELHFLERNEPQAFTMPRRNMGAPLARSGRGQLLQLRPRQPARLSQRRGELLLADGLQEVADRLRVECVDRILVVCRGKNDRRRFLERIQVPRGLDTVHSRHAHVEQYDIG